MHTQIRCLCLVVVVAVVCGSWIPDTPDWSEVAEELDSQPSSDRRASNSRRPNRPSRRHEGRRSPRLFDEFLQIIAVNGEIPEMNSDGTFAASSGRVEQVSNSTDDDVQSSVRSYIRNHRPSRREDEAAIEVEVDLRENSDDQQRGGARRSKRSYDFSSIEQTLDGIPRNHWSCCFLGELAGDKGFLCDSSFYASRVLDRNANRVHNRRMTGTYFQDGQATETGAELLNAFNSCVGVPASADEFETCCYSSLSQYEAREERWSRFSRSFRTNS